MGLLDQLWDDTVAGPRPETGLGRLRKHSSFGFRPNSGGKGLAFPFHSFFFFSDLILDLMRLTGYFSGANQEAGSGTGFGGNHHPMHMKEWWEEEGKEEEWWVLDRQILLLLMRFELP
ncbi:hypothetical protein GW17_00058322 [Ensete ventricosum]|nr:hypothetical protein GW17_00058322 [Ensete ventricosum]